MSAFSPKQNQARQRTSSTAPPSVDRAPARSQLEDWLTALQRAIGNQAVLRLLRAQTGGAQPGPAPGQASLLRQVMPALPRSATIQPKLAINSPGDVYEQEADRVSEQIMAMPQPPTAACPASSAAAGVQRKCDCGGTCDNCKADTEQSSAESKRLQMKPVAAGSLGQQAAPAIVHEVLRSPGEPLDAATRAFMEPRFGQDFSGVRVHTNERAAKSAKVVNALAYTVGENIVLGTEERDSGHAARKLLAHELAHIVQQRNGMAGTGSERLARKSPSGSSDPAPCPAAPAVETIAADCPVPEPKPGSAPPAKESPALPQLNTEPFGGDPDVEAFAEDLAACRAARVVEAEVEKRFKAAVAGAEKEAKEEAQADIEKAKAEAIAGLDPKDKKQIATARRSAEKAAKEAAAKKIAEAKKAVKQPDIDAVKDELAAKFKDALEADFAATMQAALNRYGDTWLGKMNKALAAARTRLKTEKGAKPKVKKGELAPPAKDPATIAAETEAEMVKVRCEQDNWVENQLEKMKHGWMVGRREQVDFDTLSREPFLKDFKPRRTVPTAELVKIPVSVLQDPTKPGPGIAPEFAKFLLDLKAVEPNVKGETRPAHGLGEWKDKGFSIDLYLSGKDGELDERGFYKPANAVRFLLHLDQVAKAAGARWRVIYNDFQVAEVVNKHTGTRNVGFAGGIFAAAKPDLNWHGPNPLILHFHLDIELPTPTETSVANFLRAVTGIDPLGRQAP